MTTFNDYPLLMQFKTKLQGDFITSGLIEQIDILAKRYGKEYLQLSEKVLVTLEEMGYDTFFICQQYIFDYLKQMNIFLKSGNYGHTDYDEIKATVYDNADVMMKTYMPGLFLAYANTTILYTKYNLFKNGLLPLLYDEASGVEVGFGEGFYLWELHNNLPKVKFVGFDISEHAISFASKLFDYANIPTAKYRLQLGDIITGLPEADSVYDFGILAEVIEHIENPKKGIDEIARLIKPGGHLYVSTVIDSNHMDHITNFESPEIVESMIVDSGLYILEKSVYYIKEDFEKSKDISKGLAYICLKP